MNPVPMLSPSSLRSRQSVRDSVDEKLGYGEGMSQDEAYTLLNNVERVEWLLAELLLSLRGHRLHIWHQHFLHPDREHKHDWKSIYEAIIDQSRAVNQQLAELASWTINTAADGVALVSTVPYVWSPVWDDVPNWGYQIVERWPEETDPAELQSGWRFQRSIVEPQTDKPKYPQCVIEKTAPLSRDSLTAAAVRSLWEHGASAAQLDEFFYEGGSSANEFVTHLESWVTLGDSIDQVQLQSALDPLAVALNLPSSDGQFVYLADETNYEQLKTALSDFVICTLNPNTEATIKQQLFSSLRMDVDLILLKATDVTEDEDWNLLRQAALTGHLLIIAGESEQSKALTDELQGFGFRIEK